MNNYISTKCLRKGKAKGLEKLWKAEVELIISDIVYLMLLPRWTLGSGLPSKVCVCSKYWRPQRQIFIERGSSTLWWLSSEGCRFQRTQAELQETWVYINLHEWIETVYPNLLFVRSPLEAGQGPVRNVTDAPKSHFCLAKSKPGKFRMISGSASSVDANRSNWLLSF